MHLPQSAEHRLHLSGTFDAFTAACGCPETGGELAYELERTEDGQAIKFPKRAVEWIDITDLVPHQPIWRAFTEVQVGVNKSYASSACS